MQRGRAAESASRPSISTRCALAVRSLTNQLEGPPCWAANVEVRPPFNRTTSDPPCVASPISARDVEDTGKAKFADAMGESPVNAAAKFADAMGESPVNAARVEALPAMDQLDSALCMGKQI